MVCLLIVIRQIIRETTGVCSAHLWADQGIFEEGREGGELYSLITFEVIELFSFAQQDGNQHLFVLVLRACFAVPENKERPDKHTKQLQVDALTSSLE